MEIFRFSSFVLLFSIVGLNSFSKENKKIDNLLRVAQSSEKDTVKINAYLEVSGMVSSPDSTYPFASKAM